MKKNKGACLVTGASGGIGLEIVNSLTEIGYVVIGVDSKDKATKFNGKFYINVDLKEIIESSDKNKIFINKINEFLGGEGLLALVNNAAIQKLGSVKTTSIQSFTDTLNVNVVAPFLLAKNFIPHLSKKSGYVINISSIHATQTKRNFLAYSTSKAALSGLTRAMSLDLADQGIKIFGIEPGAIDTNMLNSGLTENQFRKLTKFQPMGRIGSTSEVADLVSFLISGKCNYLNGACLRLDGGISNQLHDPGI